MPRSFHTLRSRIRYAATHFSMLANRPCICVAVSWCSVDRVHRGRTPTGEKSFLSLGTPLFRTSRPALTCRGRVSAIFLLWLFGPRVHGNDGRAHHYDRIP